LRAKKLSGCLTLSSVFDSVFDFEITACTTSEGWKVFEPPFGSIPDHKAWRLRCLACPLHKQYNMNLKWRLAGRYSFNIREKMASFVAACLILLVCFGMDSFGTW
jgi:hypothetical protein